MSSSSSAAAAVAVQSTPFITGVVVNPASSPSSSSSARAAPAGLENAFPVTVVALQRRFRQRYWLKVHAAVAIQSIWRSQMTTLAGKVLVWRRILQMVRLFPVTSLFLHFSHHVPLSFALRGSNSNKTVKVRIGHAHPFNVPPKLWSFLQHVCELRLERYYAGGGTSDGGGDVGNADGGGGSGGADTGRRSGDAVQRLSSAGVGTAVVPPAASRRCGPPAPPAPPAATTTSTHMLSRHMYAALLSKKQQLLELCEPHFRSLFRPSPSQPGGGGGGRTGTRRPPTASTVRQRTGSIMRHLEFRLKDVDAQQRSFLLAHPTLRAKIVSMLDVFFKCTHYGRRAFGDPQAVGCTSSRSSGGGGGGSGRRRRGSASSLVRGVTGTRLTVLRAAAPPHQATRPGTSSGRIGGRGSRSGRGETARWLESKPRQPSTAAGRAASASAGRQHDQLVLLQDTCCRRAKGNQGRHEALDHQTFVELFARLWRMLTPQCGGLSDRQRAQAEWDTISATWSAAVTEATGTRGMAGGAGAGADAGTQAGKVATAAGAGQLESASVSSSSSSPSSPSSAPCADMVLGAEAAHSLLAQLGWVWAPTSTVDAVMEFFQTVLDSLVVTVPGGGGGGGGASASDGRPPKYRWRGLDDVVPVWQRPTSAPSTARTSSGGSSGNGDNTTNNQSNKGLTPRRPLAATLLKAHGRARRGSGSDEAKVSYSFHARNKATREPPIEPYVRHVAAKAARPGSIFDRLHREARSGGRTSFANRRSERAQAQARTRCVAPQPPERRRLLQQLAQEEVYLEQHAPSLQYRYSTTVAAPHRGGSSGTVLAWTQHAAAGSTTTTAEARAAAVVAAGTEAAAATTAAARSSRSKRGRGNNRNRDGGGGGGGRKVQQPRRRPQQQQRQQPARASSAAAVGRLPSPQRAQGLRVRRSYAGVALVNVASPIL